MLICGYSYLVCWSCWSVILCVVLPMPWTVVFRETIAWIYCADIVGTEMIFNCELLDLLCPSTGWRHFLQCGGSLVAVSLVLEALGSLWIWLEIGNGCEDRLRLAISWWSCLIIFSNSSCPIYLVVVVLVGESNPESDPSFSLSWLTAGTSVLGLRLRIACFAVSPSSWTFSFRKSLHTCKGHDFKPF